MLSPTSPLQSPQHATSIALMADQEREQIRIYVYASAKKVVKDFAERYGQTEQNVASLVFEWFARQPKSVQKWLVGLLEDDEANDAIREYAEALLESIKPGKKRNLRGHISSGDELRKV